MERSLLILVMIMRHRAPMRLLVTTNVEEITGILHRYNNAAQYLTLTRMEKHHASPLNKICFHLDRLTPGTHCVFSITPMTFFPPRSHSRTSTETTSALRLIFQISTLRRRSARKMNRTHTIKWVIIDAHHVGYDEYIVQQASTDLLVSVDQGCV